MKVYDWSYIVLLVYSILLFYICYLFCMIEENFKLSLISNLNRTDKFGNICVFVIALLPFLLQILYSCTLLVAFFLYSRFSSVHMHSAPRVIQFQTPLSKKNFKPFCFLLSKNPHMNTCEIDSCD
jgi:hypothetical protein